MRYLLFALFLIDTPATYADSVLDASGKGAIQGLAMGLIAVALGYAIHLLIKGAKATKRIAGKTVVIAKESISQVTAAFESQKCPNCGENIKAEAIVCRYCQRDLAHPSQQTTEKKRVKTINALTPQHDNKTELKSCLIQPDVSNDLLSPRTQKDAITQAEASNKLTISESPKNTKANNDKETFEKLYQLGCEYFENYKIKEAIEALTKPAENGHVKAQLNLGMAYMELISKNKSGENGMLHINIKNAAKWIREAAQQGDADAQFVYGSMHQDGWSAYIKPDLEEAKAWYQLSANQGNETAQIMVKEIKSELTSPSK